MPFWGFEALVQLQQPQAPYVAVADNMALVALWNADFHKDGMLALQLNQYKFIYAKEPVLDRNTWHHIAFEVTITTLPSPTHSGDCKARLFVDGKPVGIITLGVGCRASPICNWGFSKG